MEKESLNSAELKLAGSWVNLEYLSELLPYILRTGLKWTYKFETDLTSNVLFVVVQNLNGTFEAKKANILR